MKLLIFGYGEIGKCLVKEIGLDRLDTGEPKFEISAIVRNQKKFCDVNASIPTKEYPKEIFTDCSEEDKLDLIKHDDYDIFVEVTPTNLQTAEPSLRYIRCALESGKHVVTANKGPLTLQFDELQALAEERGCQLGIEATVAGAIPIFSMADALKGDTINSISGILNGTTNYILSQMEMLVTQPIIDKPKKMEMLIPQTNDNEQNEKSPFDKVLNQAKLLGYAETDPRNDIDGYDAAAKLVIMGKALFNVQTSMDNVKRIGIRGITLEIIRLAHEDGRSIKLIASIDREGKAEVSPRMVSKSNALSGVNGMLNAVTFDMEKAGPLTFVGAGAGARQTVSSIMNDLYRIKESGERTVTNSII